MGRKAIPPIDVVCGECGKQYQIKGKRYNQHIKLGFKIFACSPTCRGKYANTQITESGRRKGTSPSAGWRLRKIQRQELFKNQIEAHDSAIASKAVKEVLDKIEEIGDFPHDWNENGHSRDCRMCKLVKEIGWKPAHIRAMAEEGR